MINAGMVFLTGTMVGLTTPKAAWVKLRRNWWRVGKAEGRFSTKPGDENYHRK